MNSDETFSLTPVRREQSQHAPSDAAEFLFGDADFRLCVTDRALAGVRLHARQSPTQEVGGVLLGRHFSHDGRILVVVDDHLALPSDSTSVVHFDFDQSAILALFGHLEHSADGSYVVGWYHSHVRGDPFMSEFDRQVQKNHFALPWYVSCVVVAGEWSMPAAFWRLVDDELIQLREHLIHMTPSPSPLEASGEQHRRFLRACAVQEAPLDDSVLNAFSLLPDLGVSPQGQLVKALRRLVGVDGVRPEDDTGVTSLRLILGLADALAAEPGLAAEVARARELLGTVRLQKDTLSAVLVSALFQEDIAVDAGRCYSMTPGERVIYGFGIQQAVYWSVRLNDSAGLAHLTLSRDGTLWLLTVDHLIVRIARGSLEKLGEESVKFQYNTLVVPHLSAAPEQIAGGDGVLWTRTAEQVISFPIIEDEQDGSMSLAGGTAFPLPAPGCLLAETGGRRGAKGDGLLVSFHDRKLATWAQRGDAFKRTAERALPAHWARWRLTHACLTEVGLYLLFDDDDAGQLVLLKHGSLEVACHYVHNESSDLRVPISGICADGLGRVYVKKGVALYRVHP